MDILYAKSRSMTAVSLAAQVYMLAFFLCLFLPYARGADVSVSDFATLESFIGEAALLYRVMTKCPRIRRLTVVPFLIIFETRLSLSQYFNVLYQMYNSLDCILAIANFVVGAMLKQLLGSFKPTPLQLREAKRWKRNDILRGHMSVVMSEPLLTTRFWDGTLKRDRSNSCLAVVRFDLKSATASAKTHQTPELDHTLRSIPEDPEISN
ncbi:hypothetical protein BDV93DRAFT_511490 [Ceratobasidium sp. AG-I]|nr:hypothetical protein BDV93DRAFT_511490 [Ceratobasidium sp. AG-I]